MLHTTTQNKISWFSGGEYQLLDADAGRQDEKWSKNLLNSNNSRNINSKGSLPRSTTFLKFRYKDVFKKKNKPDSALVQTSCLSNQIKKGDQNLVRLSL
jgi:hypothetical protein